MSQTLAPTRSSSSRFASISVSGLRVGVTLRSPIYDDRQEQDVLLLASGTVLTESLLSRLQSRGVSRVRVHHSELSRLIRPGGPGAQQRVASPIRHVEPELERTGESCWGRSPKSLVNKVQQHGKTGYESSRMGKFVASYRQSVKQIETLFEGLAAGDVRDATKMAAISSESLVEITEDLDLFVAMGMQPDSDKYPCKHSLQTGMLALSIGTVLGLTSEELIELGIGCLVHDAGMLHINQSVFQSEKVLGRLEFLEITKHPILTFDLMRDVKDVPAGSRMVAYQMHERCNGSGYPRQRQASQIHHLAKIAAVADVFLALISPRPHRPGMLPYHAMEQIIHGARQGSYDPAVVRGLLQTVSLFPIGSYVQLSDGRVGKVIRAGGESYTQPVVEVWWPEQPELQFETVDLRNETDLQITRALAELPQCEG